MGLVKQIRRNLSRSDGVVWWLVEAWLVTELVSSYRLQAGTFFWYAPRTQFVKRCEPNAIVQSLGIEHPRKGEHVSSTNRTRLVQPW